MKWGQSVIVGVCLEEGRKSESRWVIDRGWGVRDPNYIRSHWLTEGTQHDVCVLHDDERNVENILWHVKLLRW